VPGPPHRPPEGCWASVLRPPTPDRRRYLTNRRRSVVLIPTMRTSQARARRGRDEGTTQDDETRTAHPGGSAAGRLRRVFRRGRVILPGRRGPSMPWLHIQCPLVGVTRGRLARGRDRWPEAPPEAVEDLSQVARHPQARPTVLATAAACSRVFAHPGCARSVRRSSASRAGAVVLSSGKCALARGRCRFARSRGCVCSSPTNKPGRRGEGGKFSLRPAILG
jgi:hypothetical protein